ncbi:MAG: beta strand repeat-containing protein [Chitinophagales bacterium]
MTNINDSGEGSLRAAIECANSQAGENIITFDLIGQTTYVIFPLSQLPALEDETSIDGSAVTTGNLIIDGGLLNNNEDGITIIGSNCSVYGLQISNFPDDGIYIQENASNIEIGTAGKPNVILNNGRTSSSGDGIYAVGTDNLSIQGNLIGVNPNNSLITGNADDGIHIVNSSNVSIGGIFGNLVVKNGNDGVVIIESNAVDILGNSIGGNQGLSDDGLGNNGNGLTIIGGSNINIGASLNDSKNYILNNKENGLIVQDLSSVSIVNNIISGNMEDGIYAFNVEQINIDDNRIGIEEDETTILANQDDGIEINNCFDVTIGTVANIVSGNGDIGINVLNAVDNVNILHNYIGTSNMFGTTSLPNGNAGISLSNSSNISIGNYDNFVANAIVSNLNNGIYANNINTLNITNNLISNNTLDGIFINNSSIINVLANKVGTNHIGSAAMPNLDDGLHIANSNTIVIGAATGGNVFSGNGDIGISLASGTSDVIIANNKIGSSLNGSLAIANGGDGIQCIGNVSNLIIGGSLANESNQISGNTRSGITLNIGVNNVFIKGNKIGTNNTGLATLSNADHGIWINNANNITIGGTISAESNLISGNNNNGIYASNLSENINILANKIGTNIIGSSALANGNSGIAIDNSNEITIGGSIAAANLISGNLQNGIYLLNNSSNNNIYYNKIGTDDNAFAPIANNEWGIKLESVNNTNVGNALANQNNIIAFNGLGGVGLSNNSNNNLIVRNRIYCNNGLGIDLGDNTNNNQVSPSITNSELGTIYGTASSETVIHVYVSSDNGCVGASCQGKNYLGSTTADVLGDWTFNAPFPNESYLTATASIANNTSEFSDCFFYDDATPVINLPEAPVASLKIKALLEGAFNGETNEMNTFLRNNNLLPNSQSYNQAPWNYFGIETVSIIPNDVVDWILVQAMDEDFNIVESRASFLFKDGTISDGNNEGVKFYNILPTKNYHIAIRHRNHLDVVSQNMLSFDNQAVYDFSNPNLILLGETQLADLGDGNYGLFAGDIDGNGVMTVNDYNVSTNLLGAINTYLSPDLNLDDNITVADFNLYIPNASRAGVSQIRY